jgi:hypothetical protein
LTDSGKTLDTTLFNDSTFVSTSATWSFI